MLWYCVLAKECRYLLRSLNIKELISLGHQARKRRQGLNKVVPIKSLAITPCEGAKCAALCPACAICYDLSWQRTETQ